MFEIVHIDPTCVHALDLRTITPFKRVVLFVVGVQEWAPGAVAAVNAANRTPWKRRHAWSTDSKCAI